MNIIYSFNKTGFEAEYWTAEISGASTAQFRFIPFNHGDYLDPQLYVRAQLLDNLYYDREPKLLEMYADLEALIRHESAEALIADNFHPYHPEFLRKLDIYKVIRTSDGPISAYDRDFAYVHAYDHVLFNSPAYSRDLDMAAKLHYCGAKHIDFWPHALFDVAYDASKTEDELFSQDRDIEIIFIGGLHRGKIPFLAKFKKAFGRRCRMHGLTSLKRNVYFNVRYGFPGWIRPIPFEEYIPLYQRSRIGINLHNRGDYTVGSYRLFDLPGNGVMQLSDGGKHLESFFEVGKEIINYNNLDDLIDKVRYYCDHDAERIAIARNGYRRVVRDHRFRDRMKQAGELIQRGMSGWRTDSERADLSITAAG